MFFIHLIIATPRFNLYYTDLISQSNNAFQHNCLRIVTNIREKNTNNTLWDVYKPETNINN